VEPLVLQEHPELPELPEQVALREQLEPLVLQEHQEQVEPLEHKK
jgi:hypothetical protein